MFCGWHFYFHLSTLFIARLKLTVSQQWRRIWLASEHVYSYCLYKWARCDICIITHYGLMCQYMHVLMCDLTHCFLVIRCCGSPVSQQWFGSWLISWQQQVITLTNVNFLSMESIGTRLCIFWVMLIKSVSKWHFQMPQIPIPSELRIALLKVGGHNWHAPAGARRDVSFASYHQSKNVDESVPFTPWTQPCDKHVCCCRGEEAPYFTNWTSEPPFH